MRKHSNFLLPTSLGFCFAFLLLVEDSKAAGSLWFDVNGPVTSYGVASGGSYSWDGANWSSSTLGTTTTVNWIPGDFARFYGAASYSVTVNNDELMTGMYENGGSGNTLTINAAGLGDLDIASGDQAFLAASGTTLILNTPVVGPGGFVPESSGAIYLNGVNSYSGGTTWNNVGGAPFVYFNNNGSFGTGDIKNAFTSATIVQLFSAGGTASAPKTITLANNFDVTGNIASGVGPGFNFSNGSYTPVVMNGNVNITGNGIIQNNGDSTASLTLNGNLNVGATSTLTLAGNNGGTIYIKGRNLSALGSIAVGSSTQANVRVVLASSGALSSAANITLIGGTLDPNGQLQPMGATTLTLSAASTIDYSAGVTEIDWANSSGQTWTGILHINGWTTGDAMEIGTDATGLTQAQLNCIAFNGGSAGGAYLDSQGYLVVPEPSAMVLGSLGGLGMLITTFVKRFRKV